MTEIQMIPIDCIKTDGGTSSGWDEQRDGHRLRRSDKRRR